MRTYIRSLALLLGLLLLMGTMPVVAATGDVDESGVLDVDDAIYLLYHTLLPEEYPLLQNADYSGDAVITEQDAQYLLYHTLLPAMYPLYTDVTLPAIGTDPDGRGRISVIEATREFGTAVLTFKNSSRTWITDEASTLTYTFKDAGGKTIRVFTTYLGRIKGNSTTVCRIELPAGTASLTITGSNIEYWSDWK